MAHKGKAVEASGMPSSKPKADYDIILMREDKSHVTQRLGCFVLSLDLLEAGLRFLLPEIAKDLLWAWKREIQATAELFRSHFSQVCSPQSGDGVVYVKHRTNRMQINFSPRLSNNKGWTGRLFFVGRIKEAKIPDWDFPVRVVEPPKRVDMAPFLIKEAAAASSSLNMVVVNHAKGYLTEYKLVKYKLSRPWSAEEIAEGRDQKELVNYAETNHVSLYMIRVDKDAPAKESGAVSSVAEQRLLRIGPTKKAKTVVAGGATEKASGKAVITESASLLQLKRKKKRKAAEVESQDEERSAEEEMADEHRARKKKKAARAVPRIVEDAKEAEEEEEDLEPLLAQRKHQVARTPEQRASMASIVDRSEAVMKMSTKLGLIVVSDESDRSGEWAKSPMHETQGVLPSGSIDQGGAEQGGASHESAEFGAEDGAVAANSGRGAGEIDTFTPVTAAEPGAGEAVLPRGDTPQGSGEILPSMPPTSVIVVGCVVGRSAAKAIAKVNVVGKGAVHSGEGGTQALGSAEAGHAMASAASADEAGGEERLAVASEVGQEEEAPEVAVAQVAEGVLPSTGAAGDESSGDDRRPLTEVLKKGLPELPSKEALATPLERLDSAAPRGLPPCPSASQLEVLARCQQVVSERTPEISSGSYRPEARSDGDE
ncbi:hypothetical protein Taro_020141 [Colocasia esculenta]|uniref:Uncharacterized protein n=1 Tax=Colocasia esculenta TaxID=4460 RepID=A0A843UY35_COLES|nr:hypothetical protein [Colocasia esculenta]